MYVCVTESLCSIAEQMYQHNIVNRLHSNKNSSNGTWHMHKTTSKRAGKVTLLRPPYPTGCCSCSDIHGARAQNTVAGRLSSRKRSRMMLSWRISGRLGPEFTGKLPSGQCGDHLWGGEHAGAKRHFRQNTPSSVFKQIMKVGLIKDTTHFTGNLVGKSNIQNRSTEAVDRRDYS